MRAGIALFVASLSLIASSAAQAAPTRVNVRIEGKSETLFEGPILTEGHYVEASSDKKDRTCDGSNSLDPQNLTPGATPTAASVDAMRVIGETFDGQWYPGYEDYFITRWGPEEDKEGEFWGLLVNNVFSDVGGCQYELSTGDEVLWVYNAFGEKPFLALYPAGDTSGTRPLTAAAELGKPFEVEVVAYENRNEDEPPASPERAGSSPFAGAEVSPVQTSPKGFESIEQGSPGTVKTNSDGRASITFTEPGWHRIMAGWVEHIKEQNGEEHVVEAVRSNRLDVCVPAHGDSGCGELPAEDQVRMPPPRTEAELEAEAEAIAREEEATHLREEETRHEESKRAEEAKHAEQAKRAHEEEAERAEAAKQQEEARHQQETAKGGVLSFTASSSSPAGNPVRVQTPTLDGQGAAQGLIGVSWRILEAGVGLKSWMVASETLGVRGAGYVTRAAGTSATSALLALSAGEAYELQITFTDAWGRSSTTQIGEVLVPYGVRWSGLRYSGRWRKIKQPGAWLGTVSRAGAGAQVSTLLGPGRPVYLLRGTADGAKVEVRAGSLREVFAVASGPSAASRLITVAQRSRAGTVRLRVLTGEVDLDGVAVER